MPDPTESELMQSASILAEASCSCASSTADAAALISSSLKKGGKILLCGNGGSAADCQHFAAELAGRFEKDRKPFPAIALTTDTSLLTAVANDYGFEKIFSRQVQALGRRGDVLVAISTSGNSPNVLEAAKAAKKQGMKIIGLTGASGGKLAGLCGVCVRAPSNRTCRIQEVHSAVIHAICFSVEQNSK